VAYAALYAVFTLSGLGGTARPLILDLGQLPMPAMAMVLCWVVSRRLTGRRERLAWRLLALASLCLLVGFTAGLWREVLQAAVSAPPSPLEMAGWILFYPLALSGLMIYVPRRRRGLAGTTAALDALIITGAVLALAWEGIVGPAFSGHGAVVGPAQVGWAVGGIVLIYGVVSHFLRWPVDRVPLPLFLVAVSCTIQVAADAMYAGLSAQGAYRVGRAVDLLWPAAAGLLALAALFRRQSRGGRVLPMSAMTVRLPWLTPARVTLPYVALPVAAYVVYRGHAGGSAGQLASGARTSVFLAIGLVAVVLVRQLVLLVENRRLGRSFEDLSQELETRVDLRTNELSTRTAQLSVLNTVATRLAHCLTVDDVLAHGLRLACEAVNARVGAIWLLDTEGKTRLAARLGLPAEGDDLMGKLPRRIQAAQEVLATGRSAEAEDYSLLAYLPAGTASLLPSARLLAVPLLSRNAVVGLLGLFGGESLPDHARALAESVGAQLGVAVDNARRYEEALDMADRDALTGLLNHRAVHTRLEQELRRTERSGLDCAILMMDLDGFKALNDMHGHQAGDALLKTVAGLLRGMVRTSDVLGRYGGDEFMAILPDTGPQSARVLGDRLVQALAEHASGVGGITARVGVSVGVASAPVDGRSGAQLVAVADANMYVSKQRGGNRVTCADDPCARQPAPAAVAQVLAPRATVAIMMPPRRGD
jgi:diguanylate cyclase (GGDEF)-like protein